MKRVEDQLTHPLVLQAAEERVRQQYVEGFTFEHDDAHGMGQLAAAASTYAYPSELSYPAHGGEAENRDALWPFLLGGFKPGPNRQRELVKAVALLMAEYDRLERDLLMTEAQLGPVLVPASLCTGDQEIWYEAGGYGIQVFECDNPADGYRARVLVDGPSPVLAAETAKTQRRAVWAALVQSAVVEGDDAERLAGNWPDVERLNGLGHIHLEVHGLMVDGQPKPVEYVAVAVVDGAAVAEGRGVTEEAAKTQAILNAGIRHLQEVAVPARGVHPDQAVVETNEERD